MSATLIRGDSVKVLYSDASDFSRLEKIFNSLNERGITASIHEVKELEKSYFEFDDLQNKESHTIVVLTYRPNDINHFKEIIEEKSDCTDFIILRFDDSKFETNAEGLFHININAYLEDAIIEWVSKKVLFLQGFRETSKILFSRATHWSENEKDDEFLLEKHELFEYLHWLEQSIESQKAFRDLPLKLAYILRSRQYHYPIADCYLHTVKDSLGVGLPILHLLRDKGYEIIVGKYIIPEVYEQKFNKDEVKRSNNFIFIYCTSENLDSESVRMLAYARSLNKRIITLVPHEMKNDRLPPEIDLMNTVFIPSDWMFHNEYIKQLEQKINTERDYVAKHTYYLIRALEWIKHNRSYSFYLKKEEVNEAGEWLAKSETSPISPPASVIQKMYIEKSVAAYSLSKNLKLGATILIILLGLLGLLFSYFLQSNSKIKSKPSNKYSILNTVNTTPNADIENIEAAYAEDFYTNWEKLKSDKNSKKADFLKLYYGDSRLAKFVHQSKESITHIAVSANGTYILIAYGKPYFDMLDSKGNLMKRFNEENYPVYKAAFLPWDNKMIAIRSKKRMSLRQVDGKQINELNVGEKWPYQDFVFLANTKQIALLNEEKNVIMVDETLQKSNEIAVNEPILKLYNATTSADLQLVTTKNIYTYLPLDKTSINKEALPAKVKDFIPLANNHIALTHDNQLLKRNKNGEWQPINKNTKPIDKLVCLALEDNSTSFFTITRDFGVQQINTTGEYIATFKHHKIVAYEHIFAASKNEILVVGKDEKQHTLCYKFPLKRPFFAASQQLTGDILEVLPVGGNRFLFRKQYEIELFDSTNGNIVWRIRNENRWHCLAFYAQETLLAGGDSQGYIHWISLEGKKIKKIKAHHTKVNMVAFNSVKPELISSSEDYTLKAWDKKGKMIFKALKHKSAINHLVFSRDGKYFMSSSNDGKLFVWETNGKLYNELKGAMSACVFADFSKSSNFIVSLGMSGDYTIWDLEGNIISFETARSKELYKKIFFSKDGEAIILMSDNKIQGINALGEVLYQIELPTNLMIEDIFQPAVGLAYFQALVRNNIDSTLLIGKLPMEISTLEASFPEAI